MGFKDQLKRLKNDLVSHAEQARSSGSSTQEAGGVGPPNAQSTGGTIYWQPPFHQDCDVSQHFEQKTGHGQDGWGNWELQNYTSESKNVFL